MDDALKLRQAYDDGAILSDDTIHQYLHHSDLISKLCDEFSTKSLYPIWRLIALSEIPYSNRLTYTQTLMDHIIKTYGHEAGFSLTGKADDLLPCYNGMLLEAFSKLGVRNEFTENAVQWIKKYQVFDRNAQTTWSGKGIQKYGGCMKQTPCYIGIAKSVKALIHYQRLSKDDSVQGFIDQGVSYILSHHLIFRQSKEEPITKHIKNIAFPPSYQLNVLELLEIIYLAGCMDDPRVEKVKSYLENKRHAVHDYKINYVYKADGYISFDSRGQKGEWVSYLIQKYLKS